MKAVSSVCLLLLIVSCPLQAEMRTYGVSGVAEAVVWDSSVLDCGTGPYFQYQVCYSIDSDTNDLDASPTVGVYPPSVIKFDIGTCSFLDTYGYMLGFTDEGPLGDEVYLSTLGEFIPIGGSVDDGVTFQMDVWAAATSPSSFVTGDSLPFSPPDLSLADSERKSFAFVATDQHKAYGSIGGWYYEPDFCSSTGALIAGLIADIHSLDLPDGISQSLERKLAAVIDILASRDLSNLDLAIKQMESFVKRVEAMSGKKISEDDAAYLVSKALDIIASI